jgi:hypothetical protein
MLASRRCVPLSGPGRVRGSTASPAPARAYARDVTPRYLLNCLPPDALFGPKRKHCCEAAQHNERRPPKPRVPTFSFARGDYPRAAASASRGLS